MNRFHISFLKAFRLELLQLENLYKEIKDAEEVEMLEKEVLFFFVCL